MIDLPRCTCLRCGHVWVPRISAKPKQCPRCKQPGWDRPARWTGKVKPVNTWTRYQEIELTTDENELVDRFGPNAHECVRNGKEFILIAQDDERCIWGYASRQGNLAVAPAGHTYQNQPEYHKRYDEILLRYGAIDEDDSYNNAYVVRLPLDSYTASLCMRALNRLG